MIGYTTLGTNKLDAAKAFYDELLAELGATRQWDIGRGVAWGRDAHTPSFAVLTPFDGQAATVGNGDMVALMARSREEVDRVHAKALAMGCPDEGAPGVRGGNFYGGYFRDLEGHKLAVFFIG